MENQEAATSDDVSNNKVASNCQISSTNPPNIVENGISSVKQSSNHIHNNHKKNDAKERKFDLNSFSTVKNELAEADEDDDDKPLAARKQKPVESGKPTPKDKVCLPNRTQPKDLDSQLHPQHGKKNDKQHLKPARHEETQKSPEKSNQSEHAAVCSKENLRKNEKIDEKSHKDMKIKQEEPDDLQEKRPKIKGDHKMTELKPEMQKNLEKGGKTAPKRPKIEETDDEDELSLAVRSKKSKHIKKEHSSKNRRKHVDDDESEDEKPLKKTKVLESPASPSKPKGGRKKKEEEQPEVWKWWEEEDRKDGVKWKFLEHKGPMFAPLYVPLPSDVKFFYDGKPMKLSELAEETATFYSKMIEHDYVTHDAFNKNFFKDWRKVMTAKEKETITDLSKCGFKEMHAYFTRLSEERKSRSKEEKLKEKEKADQIQKEYGIAVIDGHKEKIGNFRIEPPGLFRGRGTHPKMGMLKRRIQPEDVMINCSKDSKIPSPPAGHKWKEVRHDNAVTWLASWNENIMNGTKYVMLNPSSKIKGEKDWQKYETARHLKSKVHRIRETYKEDWKSKEMKSRQRAVALYFIDKLALRAGNEKEEGETADTVGCCSLRCEHIKLHEQLDGEEWVVEFDFLGKDSIRYYNRTPVEKRVFKNLNLFMENKSPGDDLFDRLNTAILNKHLTTLMDGLTAKVFRTYNASFTLQQQLDMLTTEDMSPAEKLLSYNRANRQVAILCNHQRSVPKAHGKQMELLQEKIDEKEKAVKSAKGEMKDAKKAYKDSKNEKNKKLLELKQKKYERMQEDLGKLQVKATDKEENKEISLGTSKLNYLDPRISVAWCKKWSVPLEKVYNKTQREKFRWAIDMAGPDFKW